MQTIAKRIMEAPTLTEVAAELRELVEELEQLPSFGKDEGGYQVAVKVTQHSDRSTMRTVGPSSPNALGR